MGSIYSKAKGLPQITKATPTKKPMTVKKKKKYTMSKLSERAVEEAIGSAINQKIAEKLDKNNSKDVAKPPVDNHTNTVNENEEVTGENNETEHDNFNDE